MDHAVELLLRSLSISLLGIFFLISFWGWVGGWRWGEGGWGGGVEVNLKKNVDSVYMYKTTFLFEDCWSQPNYINIYTRVSPLRLSGSLKNKNNNNLLTMTHGTL